MMSLALAALAIMPNKAPVPERRVLLPFDYSGVRITGGMFRKQLDETKEYYLRIPNDDLLMPYRRRAGLPHPGHELGGWYSDDVFHIFGQILSGLARLYRATGDEECKAKAGALLDGWQKCIAPDGYFYADPKPNAYHYIYDKMVGGLVDMAIYCGRKDALNSLAKITDWAEKNLDRRNVYAGAGESSSTEWYTLSENLYRAYLLTGDQRYEKFAKVWEYTDYWKLYATHGDLFGKRPDGGQTLGYHAYSHVNNLGGAAMAYRITGDQWYLDTVKNAYDYLQANECFATGGYGPDETLARREVIHRKLMDTTATFETQCGTWAGFKLSKHLISLTGDAKYGDWIESLAYSGIGATIPMDSGGDVFYYSSYNPYGAYKRNHWDAWSCCAGTRPMSIADVCDLIYFAAPDGLDVNLFVPSTIDFEFKGAKVHLEQETKFPDEPRTSFVIRVDTPAAHSTQDSANALDTTHNTSADAPNEPPSPALLLGEKSVRNEPDEGSRRADLHESCRSGLNAERTTHNASLLLTLRFRKPGWLTSSPTATINGQPVTLKQERGEWLAITREWKDGDRVELNLPMGFRFVPLFQGETYPAAITYGPAVLAFRSYNGSPTNEVDLKDLANDFAPSPGEPLTFHLKKDPAVLLRPFYAYKEGETYYMYLDPSANGRISYSLLKLHGNWKNSGKFWFSNEIGASCEGAFSGTAVRVLGYRYDDAGHAEVRIDDKVVGVIDEYGPGRDLPGGWDFKGLAPGKHTIKITVLNEKAAESKDHYINVAGLEIPSLYR